jgi:hypothetical protein
MSSKSSLAEVSLATCRLKLVKFSEQMLVVGKIGSKGGNGNPAFCAEFAK